MMMVKVTRETFLNAPLIGVIIGKALVSIIIIGLMIYASYELLILVLAYHGEVPRKLEIVLVYASVATFVAAWYSVAKFLKKMWKGSS